MFAVLEASRWWFPTDQEYHWGLGPGGRGDCRFPDEKIASAIILYRLVAAMVRPSVTRLTQALFNGRLLTLFVAVGTVALMFSWPSHDHWHR